jgi:hypothetical protein
LLPFPAYPSVTAVPPAGSAPGIGDFYPMISS